MQADRESSARHAIPESAQAACGDFGMMAQLVAATHTVKQAAGQGEAPAAGGSGEGFVNPLAQNGTTDGPSEGAEEESSASV